MIFKYQMLSFDLNSVEEFNEAYDIIYDQLYEIIYDIEYGPRLEEDYEDALMHNNFYPDYRVDTAMSIYIDNYSQEAHYKVKCILAKWLRQLTAGHINKVIRHHRRKNALAGRF